MEASSNLSILKRNWSNWRESITEKVKTKLQMRSLCSSLRTLVRSNLDLQILLMKGVKKEIRRRELFDWKSYQSKTHRRHLREESMVRGCTSHAHHQTKWMPKITRLVVRIARVAFGFRRKMLSRQRQQEQWTNRLSLSLTKLSLSEPVKSKIRKTCVIKMKIIWSLDLMQM